MEFRSRDDQLATFAPFEASLDRLVEGARPSLFARGLEIRDLSNRTGFDQSGYGCPEWRYEFETRRQAGNFIVSMVATITYRESLDTGESATFTEEWKTDIFILGAISTFKAFNKSPVTLEDLAVTGFENRVLALLQKAAAVPYPWAGP